ncbi:hypothetical protein A5320_18290 [Rheinheimera sp. SA_1]|uniref:non-ribosomal peptide synthetase n=1 Tax=Rheinheimera sp. SA_1 TaxID=1827365 RepID=UPI0007FF1878|nr:non-ribosomal peptide synthetase [Rheinheimera sp. SA_1]OBP13497.1 hypothetical protein A5320_18290 [Rheinheimera sp. SA_1]
MTVDEVLALAIAGGVYLYVDGDKLKYKVAAGGLPADLAVHLKANKAAIIWRLNGTESAGQWPLMQQVNRAQPQPLSYAQQRLWFLHQLRGASDAYNIMLAFRTAGAVDVTALSQALQALLQRHQVLRTRFVWDGAEVTQTIDTAPWIITPEWLADEAALRLQYFAEQNYQFDLAAERLCRIRLLQLSGQSGAVLLACLHHSIFDGWSGGIFLAELAALYQAFSRGQPSPLPELSLQYADYANWQRQYLQGPMLAKQIAFWAGQLAGLAPLQLPTDRPGRQEQAQPGDTLAFALPAALSSQLTAFCQQQQVTLFMTLISAFACLLSRYSGQQDVALGTPIANRHQAQTEGMLGFFVNTLVMRCELSDQLDFIGVLHQMRDRALAAYAHQDLPFEKLVEVLNPERSNSASPFFQVMFALQNTPQQTDASADLQWLPLLLKPQQAGEYKTARFDLTLVMQDSATGLRGEFEYNTALFDRETIERLARHFRRFIELVLAQPRQLVSRYDFLDMQDVALLCPAAPPPLPLLDVSQLLLGTQWQEARLQLTAALQAAGVAAAEWVGVRLADTMDKIVAIAAIQACDACAVLIPTEFPALRQQAIIADSSLRLVIDEHGLTSGQSLPATRQQSDYLADRPALILYPLRYDGRLCAQSLTQAQLAAVLGGDCADLTAPAAMLYGVDLPAEATLLHSLRCLLQRMTLDCEPAPAQAYLSALALQAVTQSQLTAADTLTITVVEPNGQLAPPGVVGELCVGADRQRTGKSARRANDGSWTLVAAKPVSAPMPALAIKERLCALDTVQQAAVVARNTVAGLQYHVYVVATDSIAAVATQLRKGPHGRLPDQWLRLESLPLNGQGEVCLQALPAIGDQSQRLAPANQREAALYQIWQQVLGFTDFGVTDNFFVLGGDSILSIQLVSRARSQGLQLSVSLLFEYPTIRELAAHLLSASQQFEQAPAVGSMPLLPVQHWFFAEQTAQPGYFHQSQLLTVPADADLAFVQTFVQAVASRHDALRLIFTPEPYFVPLTAAVLGTMVLQQQLQGSDRQQYQIQLEQYALAVKQSFTLADGPLFKAVLFEATDPSDRCLLLVLHHLIVDGVSWRVLLSDLTTVYTQWRQQQQIKLAAKTTSYQHWAMRVADSSADEQRDFWLAQYQTMQIPADHPLPQGDASDTFGASQQVMVGLTEQETKDLLGCGGVYRTQLQHLLLCALLRAFEQWNGCTSLTLLLEGHGRQTELFAGTDLTETIGWFTTLYPLTLQGGQAELGEQIKSVKEQCLQIPHQGFGYGVLRYLQQVLPPLPEMAVVFNYLGQFDQQFGPQALFAPVGASSGADFAADRVRHYQLGFNGSVLNGRLVFVIDYCPLRHHKQTIEWLGQRFTDALHQIVRHCAVAGPARLTPGDFPLARLDRPTLDLWQQHYPTLQDIYPLTGMQLGMLFHSLLDDEDRSAYVTQVYVDLVGHLDCALFEQVWVQLVNRYAVLRSAYPDRARAEPVQLVCAGAEVTWQQLDWRQQAHTEQCFEQFRLADKAEGFDFDQPPLMRMALLRLADQRWRWLWTHHHSLLDGWSFSLLFNEMLQRYLALRQGYTLDLPAAVPYREYLRWLQTRDQQQAERYWREHLSGVTAASRLPLEPPAHGQTISPGSAQLKMQLSRGRSSALVSAARHYGVTLNTLMQAAWARLLAKYTGTSTVVFGQTISCRPAEVAGIEQMVGLLINTIAVRLDVATNQRLADWLQNLHRAQIEREEFGYLPLHTVNRLAGLGYGQNLFNTLLVFENYPQLATVANHDDYGFTIETLDTSEGADYDLTMRIGAGAELVLHLDYQPSLFAAGAVAELLGHFVTLLQSVADVQQTKVRALECLSSQQQRQQLHDWQPPAAAFAGDVHLAWLFEQQVADTPEAVALVAGGLSLSYRELNGRANRVARYLQTKGVGPEVVVGLCAERSLELAIGLLAIVKAGGCYLPLDPQYPQQRLAAMLAHSGCRLILSESHLLEQLELLHHHQTFALDHPVCQQLLRAYSTDNVQSGLHADNLAYLIYTSGSTGQPKGIAVSHRNVHRLVRGGFVHLDGNSVVLCAASPSFDAFTFEFWSTLLAGGTAVLADLNECGFTGLAVLIGQYQIDTAWLTAALFNRVIDDAPQTLSGLRQLLIGGEALSVAHLQKASELLPATMLINGYGPTENTTFSCTWPVDQNNLQHCSSAPIGKALMHSAAYVLDEDLQLLPVGAVGRLYLAGSGLARGYLGQSGLTASRFVPNPFAKTPGERLYHSGDLARYMPGGNIAFVGREDQQVKLRGFRIELAEITAVLRQHPSVCDCTVQLQTDVLGQPRLVAFVVLDPSAVLPQYQSLLAGHLAQSLPDYMLPSAWQLLEQLPLNANGKLDLAALPVMDWQHGAEQHYVAPTSELEAALAELWQHNLQLNSIGINDNYFVLGGDSIRSIALVAAAQQQNIWFSVKNLFDAPTIAALAQVIMAGQADRLEATPQIAAFSLLSDDEMQSLMGQFNIEV